MSMENRAKRKAAELHMRLLDLIPGPIIHQEHEEQTIKEGIMILEFSDYITDATEDLYGKE